MNASNRGFTLIEIIITLVISAIAAGVLIQFMGTAFQQSSKPVVVSQREGLVERQMEAVVSSYVAAMNILDFDAGDDPQVALQTLSSTINAGNFDQGSVAVTSQFVAFVNGVETAAPSPPTDTLRVTVTATNPSDNSVEHTLSTLLTATRNDRNPMMIPY